MGYMMEEKEKIENVSTLHKLVWISSSIASVIVLIYFAWGIISDRYAQTSSIMSNQNQIEYLKNKIIMLENNENDLNDIKYNLRRLMEKQGLHWQSLNDNNQ
jgi:predicted PurR-regulated permease PerM